MTTAGGDAAQALQERVRMAKEDDKRWLLAKNRGKGKGKNKDGGELLASGSSPLPIKRQRIPLTMPLQIVDADWGTSLSRLRHQLQDESPLYPEGLSSESSDSRDEEEEETREGRTSTSGSATC